MEPSLFRRKLRGILLNTVKASALAGAVLAGCDLKVLPSLQEGINEELAPILARDAGISDENEFKPKCTPLPDLTPAPPEPLSDGAELPPRSPAPDHGLNTRYPDELSRDKIICGVEYVQLTQCEVAKENCRPPQQATYHRLLTADVPSPLSYEECIRLCKEDLDVLCKDNNNYTTYKSFDQCNEAYSTQNQRMLVCNYTVNFGCGGRLPEGLQEAETKQVVLQDPMQEVGQFFAHMAYLESAAVTAFSYLVQELEAYNAPQELVAIAKKAIDEEVEHAKMMTALADRYGATPAPVEVAPFSLRSLEEIAIENAREGCVRESFGSLLGMWQATFSQDPAVREIMTRIAHEESEHGALSWAIDAWARPQLSAEAIKRYEEAHQQAQIEILGQLQEEPSEAMVLYAGFPTQAQAHALLETLRNTPFA